MRWFLVILVSACTLPGRDGFATIEQPGWDDPDNDGLGIDDHCPTDQEDRDGVEDADGCPDLDNDRDGVPDRSDACPDRAAASIASWDGCPSAPDR